MQLSANDFYKVRWYFRLTQEDMAAVCNVSSAQISRIENGRRNLTERVKRRLISKLQLTPEKLARILALYEETNIRGI